jgi:PQQ-dependent catabolism-associated beta-propeller protein
MRNSLSALCLASAFLLLSACGPEADNSDTTQENTAAPAATTTQSTTTTPTQANPAVAQTSASYLVYVTNEDSNNVTVIDGDTHNVLQTIDIGKRPRGLKVSPDGRLLYVAVSGAPKCPPTMDDEECEKLEVDLSADGIAEVDTATRTVRRVLPSGLDPEQFDLNWETGMMYVANENANLASILDVANGAIVQTVDTGREPEGVRVSPDGRFAYVTGEVDSDITVIDTATGMISGKIAVGLRPRDITFSSDSTRAYISNEIGASISVIDVAAQTVVQTFSLPEGSLPMGLALAPDNKTLYVANGRAKTVMSINVDSGEIIKSVEAGQRPWGITLSPDGSKLFTANGPSNDVSVIDVASFTVIATVPVGSTPWGVWVGKAP